MRRRGLRTKRFVRGFDWDYSQHTGLIDGNSGGDRGWIRIPSDNFDSLSGGQLIEPKTAVRLLVYPFVQIQGLTSPPAWPTFYFGVIAWSGVDESAPALADTPDPRNGALDWLAWVAMPVGYIGGGGIGDSWYSTFQYGTQQGCLDFKSQRKLPPNKGLLAVYGAGGGSVGSSMLFNVHYRIGLKGDVTAPGLGGS